MKRALLALAGILALGAAGWAVWSFGPESIGGPTRVDIGAGPLARLDSVSLRRRIVTASVTGRVIESESDVDVLLTDGDGAITVRLDDEHGIQQGSTLLAVGRVREQKGAPRRLDAVSWAEVEGFTVPSFDGPDSVRVLPDSTRFGTESDRSGDGSDRSGGLR